MRIARLDDNLVGVVLDDGVHDVNSVLTELAALPLSVTGT
jgi:hypothetical protein